MRRRRGGPRGLGFHAVDVVAGDDEQFGGDVGFDAKSHDVGVRQMRTSPVRGNKYVKYRLELFLVVLGSLLHPRLMRSWTLTRSRITAREKGVPESPPVR